MRAEQVLLGLNEAQVTAVTAPSGPLLISAGAGTGKTSTVTARIAYRVADSQVPAAAILAVTHSTRAAGQLRDSLRKFRIGDLDRVATRTIHAAALNQLKFSATSLGIGPEPVVCSDQFQTVREISSSLRLATTRPVVAAILAEISWAKSQLADAEQYLVLAAAAGRRAPVALEQVAAVYARYTQSLQRRGLLDHTDILTRAAAQILEHSLVATEVRRRCRFLVVDEYQDTDPSQHALVRAWLGEGDDLTVVGDARQAIYAFKGADSGLMARFTQEFPTARTAELTVNYRSSSQILTIANALAANLPAAAGALQDLTAANPAGPTPSVRALPTPDAEEKWVATQIASGLRSGSHPSQVAVLVRDNRRAIAVSDQLEALGVPTWVSGGTRFFDAPEIAAVRTLMRAQLEAGSELPGAGLLREVLADAGFNRDRPPTPGTAMAPVWRARRALLDWVEALPSAEMLGARHLLAELDLAAASGHQVAIDAVFVGTVHAAKGLEFDAIFSLGWDQNWTGAGQEGNLAYVAVTRARKQLTLTWAQERDGRRMAVSPLVERAGFYPVDERTHLPGEPPKARRRPAAKAAVTGGGRCRRCKVELPAGAGPLRACPQHLTGVHAQVWAALMSWREDQATMSGQPAYRVITGETALLLLAAAPTTLDDLRQIAGVGPVTVNRYGYDLLSLIAPAAAL